MAAHSGGSRVISAAEFYRGYLTTALESGELLTQVRFPAAAPHTGAAFLEVARRRGDFALVGCAAQVTLADRQAAGGEVIADARICLSGSRRCRCAAPGRSGRCAGWHPALCRGSCPILASAAADRTVSFRPVSRRPRTCTRPASSARTWPGC